MMRSAASLCAVSVLLLASSNAFSTRTASAAFVTPSRLTTSTTIYAQTNNHNSEEASPSLSSQGDDVLSNELSEKNQPWFSRLSVVSSLPVWSLALAALITVTALPPMEHATAATTTTTPTTTTSKQSTTSSFGDSPEKRLRDSAKAAVETTTNNLVKTGRDIDATKADYGKVLRAVNQQKSVLDRAEISLRTEQARLDRIKKSATRESILRQKERVVNARVAVEMEQDTLTTLQNTEKATSKKLDALRKSFIQSEKTIQKAKKDYQKADQKYTEYLQKVQKREQDLALQQKQRAEQAKQREQQQAAQKRKQAQEQQKQAAAQKKKALQAEKAAAEKKAQQQAQYEQRKANAEKKRLEKERQQKRAQVVKEQEAKKRAAVKEAQVRKEQIQQLERKIDNLRTTRGDLIVNDAPTTQVDEVEAQLANLQKELRNLSRPGL